MTDLSVFADDFVHEAMYGPEAWFVHRLLRVDPEARVVEAELDTAAHDALVVAQREVAGHEKHLPAASVIQATGTMGQLYAVYALGLRATSGWSGYGTHIREARFHSMGIVGPPVHITLTCTRQRQMMGAWFCEFDFAFRQADSLVYTSKQSAAWRRRTVEAP